jgi:chloride channel 3/4/5
VGPAAPWDKASANVWSRPCLLKEGTTWTRVSLSTLETTWTLHTGLGHAADIVMLGSNLQNSGHSNFGMDRVWYDQFTSTDWVHDSIADAFRVKALHSRKDWRGKLYIFFDGAQGWILVAIIGVITACIAYFVNVTETVIFDYKNGFCSYSWSLNKKKCCSGATACDEWLRWSEVILSNRVGAEWVDFMSFVFFVVALSMLSCCLTLLTKTVVPSNIQISTLDENFGAENRRLDRDEQDNKRSLSPPTRFRTTQQRPPMVYYSAAGSGVAEIKVIVSGFVLHGYLGVKTLVIKTLALILSIASGLSIGKEGPYVHIATCVGNITCRMFSKYNNNDGKRREVLSASAASGVAVAFGSPIGGVLFSLEEVSYYFPPKTLFRTFFCCIVAALSLKFLNPYGTGKIVLFQVRYITDWHGFEMVAFVLLGILGGMMGALFIKAARFWAQTFRQIPVLKRWPILEVALIALVTGVVSFWNRYTRLPVTELLLEIASPCDTFTSSGNGLCPTKEQIPEVIRYLFIAFFIKAILTTISFGIKVPAGIYVPSMVVGGLLGRIVGHMVQYLALNYSHTGLFGDCSPDAAPEDCVVPGVYAMVAAGATMCGVTRLSVTLAVILFELTGSLDHVLPFSIGVLVSKWTADALEPLSIYDLLTDMNSYPFLDNKVRPVFTTELGDIVPHHLREERIIDISNSPLVAAKDLRSHLEYLHMAGELDGGLPVLKEGVLVGLIPAPDLEFALDRLENEDNSLCLMSSESGVRWHGADQDAREMDPNEDPTDFTPFIDPAPVALDTHSPMDLVYECFVKLGLRYICVLRDGKYAGLVSSVPFLSRW